MNSTEKHKLLIQSIISISIGQAQWMSLPLIVSRTLIANTYRVIDSMGQMSIANLFW